MRRLPETKALGATGGTHILGLHCERVCPFDGPAGATGVENALPSRRGVPALVETHLARPAFLALQQYSNRDAQYFGDVVRAEIAPLQASVIELSTKQDESNRMHELRTNEVKLELTGSIQDVKTSTATGILGLNSSIQDLKNSNWTTTIVASVGAVSAVVAAHLMSERSKEKTKTDVQIAQIAANSQDAKAKLDMDATLEAARIAANSQEAKAKLDLEATLEAARIAADSQQTKAKLDLEATLEAARIAANSQLEIAKINAAKRGQGMAG